MFGNWNIYGFMISVGSELASKGMLLKGLEFQRFSTKFNTIEQNKIAADLFKKYFHSVVDLHMSFQAQTSGNRRLKDGIHWDPKSNRLMVNKILTHLTLSLFGESMLPGRLHSQALERLRNQGNTTWLRNNMDRLNSEFDQVNVFSI